MAHLGVRAPVTISFGSTIGPSYSTDVVVTDGGKEQRNQNWQFSRLRGDLSYAARVANREAELLELFHMARGRLHSFSVRDASDYKVPDGAGIGVLIQVDGSSSGDRYQLYKQYGTGTYAQLRKITRPDEDYQVTVEGDSSGTVTVTHVDYDTGIITVSAGVPGIWNGRFDVPCRFDTDEMSREIIDRAGTNADGSPRLIMGWSQAPIVEVRE